MAQNVPAKQDAQQQVSNAFHILNNFDISPGLVSLGGGFGGATGGFEKTYWSSVSDMKNQIFYIRTYNDPGVQAMRMADIDLSIPEIKTYNLNNPWTVSILTEKE